MSPNTTPRAPSVRPAPAAVLTLGGLVCMKAVTVIAYRLPFHIIFNKNWKQLDRVLAKNCCTCQQWLPLRNFVLTEAEQTGFIPGLGSLPFVRHPPEGTFMSRTGVETLRMAEYLLGGVSPPLPSMNNMLPRLLHLATYAGLALLAASPAFAQPTASAAAVPPTPPPPTLEQRVAGLEAHPTNPDPTAALKTEKDKDGNMTIPKDLTTPAVGTSGPGHNAWQMTSAALVLFMTLPGLALFYGGLVRRKNVLSVMAQCLLLSGWVTILWWAVGYSLVFHSGNPFMGGLGFSFLKDVGSAPNTDYSYWVSHNVFSMYQLMFAIITPALIVGVMMANI